MPNIWRFSPYSPNTEGTTVVIPKKHYLSYPFDLSDEILTGLMLAGKESGKTP